MNELLLVVAAIFVLCMVVGISKGLIRIVASLLATLIILVVVVVATPYVGDTIANYTSLEETVKAECIELVMTEGVAAAENATQEVQITLIENSELPGVFKEMLLVNNNPAVYESLGVTNFVDYVGTYFARLVLNIVAFLVTFIVATVVVRTILYILGVIGDLPVIGGINRLAGGIVGLGTGLIIVWVLFIAITVFYDMSISKLFLENIAENELLRFLYNNNILMNFVAKVQF